jgi:hypothetical protein
MNKEPPQAYMTILTVGGSMTRRTHRNMGVSLSEFVAKDRLLRYLRGTYTLPVVDTKMNRLELKRQHHLDEYPIHEIRVSLDRDLYVLGSYQWMIEPYEIEGELR